MELFAVTIIFILLASSLFSSVMIWRSYRAQQHMKELAIAQRYREAYQVLNHVIQIKTRLKVELDHHIKIVETPCKTTQNIARNLKEGIARAHQWQSDINDKISQLKYDSPANAERVLLEAYNHQHEAEQMAVQIDGDAERRLKRQKEVISQKALIHETTADLGKKIKGNAYSE